MVRPRLNLMSRSFNHTILAISIAVILVVLLGGFGPAGVSASQSDGAFRQMGVTRKSCTRFRPIT